MGTDGGVAIPVTVHPISVLEARLAGAIDN